MMTDEEHYYAMAKSMGLKQDDMTVVSGTGTMEDPLILGGTAIDELAALLDLAAALDQADELDDGEEEDAEDEGISISTSEPETPQSIAEMIIYQYVKSQRAS